MPCWLVCGCAGSHSLVVDTTPVVLSCPTHSGSPPVHALFYPNLLTCCSRQFPCLLRYFCATTPHRFTVHLPTVGINFTIYDSALPVTRRGSTATGRDHPAGYRIPVAAAGRSGHSCLRCLHACRLLNIAAGLGTFGSGNAGLPHRLATTCCSRVYLPACARRTTHFFALWT